MATTRDSIARSYNLIDGKMAECPNNKGKYITSDYLSFGDYDNSTDVHRSNVAYIEQNYASNRYHIVYGHYGYTHLYLKNTDINAELVTSLNEYPVICDNFYSNWQSTTVKSQFNDSYIKDYPVIYSALELINADTDWTISDKIYKCLDHFSDLWNGGESYYWDGNCYYFSLMHDRYNTDDNVLLVLEWFTENGVYSKLADDRLKIVLSPIVDRIYTDARYDNCVYCLQLQSYSDIVLHSGSSDYMCTHQYPFMECDFDRNITKSDILSYLRYTYNTLCDMCYEQLDKLPT